MAESFLDIISSSLTFRLVLSSAKNELTIDGNNKNVTAIIDMCANSQLPVGELSTLYSTLSHDIHGKPWNGPAVHLHIKSLAKKEYSDFLTHLAEHLNLPVERNDD